MNKQDLINKILNDLRKIYGYCSIEEKKIVKLFADDLKKFEVEKTPRDIKEIQAKLMQWSKELSTEEMEKIFTNCD